MAKRWKKEDLTYLKRYAGKRTVAELAERFASDNDSVTEQLQELKVQSKDGFGYREPYVDPALVHYEKGLKSFFGGKIADAKKHFEKVVAESDQADTAMRARSFLTACAERLQKDDTTDLDPYTSAVMAKNSGDEDSALEMCMQGGRSSKDARFAYLAAAILAGREDGDQAMTQLLKAIELEATNRVQAYHDRDFDELREREDFQELYAEE